MYERGQGNTSPSFIEMHVFSFYHVLDERKYSEQNFECMVQILRKWFPNSFPATGFPSIKLTGPSQKGSKLTSKFNVHNYGYLYITIIIVFPKIHVKEIFFNNWR